MKVQIFIIAVCLGLGQANFLDNLKHSFEAIGQGIKQTATDFVPYANQVGKNLLSTAKNDTLSMLGGTMSSLIGDGLAKLFQGKREAVDMRKALLSELTSLLHLGTSQYGQVVQQVFGEIKDIKDKLSELKVNPIEAISMLEQVVGNHAALKSEFLDALERDVGKVVEKVLTNAKRNTLTDTVSKLGKDVAAIFRPALEKIHAMVEQAKNSLVQVAKTLMAQAKQNVEQAGVKLLGQVLPKLTQVKTDGVSAFTAVKDVLPELLNQA